METPVAETDAGPLVVAIEGDEPRQAVAAALEPLGLSVEAAASLAALGSCLTSTEPTAIVVGDDLGRRPFRATRSRTTALIVGLLGWSEDPSRCYTAAVDATVEISGSSDRLDAARGLSPEKIQEIVGAVERTLPTDSGGAVTPGDDHAPERSLDDSAHPSPSTTGSESTGSTTAVPDEEGTRSASPERVQSRSPVETSADTEQTGPYLTAGTSAHESIEGTVVIGASAGGPGVLTSVLSALPGDAGLRVLVVQHLRDAVVSQFAARVDRHSQLSVSVADDERRVGRGEIAIARGNSHLAVAADRGDELSLRCIEGPPQNDVQPAADETMRTAAARVNEPLVGVLLTGIGVDGAAGLAAIAEAGGWTIAQDEATSHIFGMPAAAIEAGAVDEVLPGDKIANGILRALADRFEKQ